MNCSFTDKDRATDLLNTEKHLASCYGSQLLEAATPEVVACLKELQGSTYSLQEQLFAEAISDLILVIAEFTALVGITTVSVASREVNR